MSTTRCPDVRETVSFYAGNTRLLQGAVVSNLGACPAVLQFGLQPSNGALEALDSFWACTRQDNSFHCQNDAHIGDL